MDLAALPLQPPAPLPATATDAQRATHANLWRAYSDLAVAVAMSEAAQLQAQAAATMAAARLPTRAELVFELLKVQPQATLLTATTLVKGASDIVDAFVKAYPSHVQA